MSVYALVTKVTNERVASDAAAAPGAMPPPPAAPGGGVPGLAGTTVSQALESIGTYIPTEVMATYLALLALVPATRGHIYQWLMFWFFVIATPIVVWLGVAAAHREKAIALPLRPTRQWPWWPMLGASLAFVAFVVGLPGSVVNDLRWFEPWMGSAAIILSAFVLSQGGRLAAAK